MAAAVIWGAQFVPLKLLHNPDMMHFHVFMSAGIFLTSFGIAFLFGANLVLNGFALPTGLLWGVGNVLNIVAIDRMGLA